MSRIGKQPIPLPAGVTATIVAGLVTVTGPKGTLTYQAHRDIEVVLAENTLTCQVKRKSKQAAALWGTTRANVANVVQGAAEGFKKQLELHGVGYRAAVKGKNLELALGFSHPVVFETPEGITFSVQENVITIEGADVQKVGQIAADIREVRKPEPYKGKGVRYVGEKVRRKVGKVVGTAE